MMMKLSGNISESARILGLTRRGLYLKLRRLGLESGGLYGYQVASLSASWILVYPLTSTVIANL